MRKPFVPKKYLKLYEETARQKVLQVLFRFPEKEFSMSDLASEAGVAKANIGKILDEFSRLGLIDIVKLSKIWRIKGNQSSWYFIRGKVVYNLDFIYNSGIVEFLNERFDNPKAIVLFGSFRKGEDISGSDIDIAIESDDFKGHEVIGMKDLGAFENDIGRKIQLHLFNRKEIDINIFNNIANGIVLMGFLMVSK